MHQTPPSLGEKKRLSTIPPNDFQTSADFPLQQAIPSNKNNYPGTGVLDLIGRINKNPNILEIGRAETIKRVKTFGKIAKITISSGVALAMTGCIGGIQSSGYTIPEKPEPRCQTQGGCDNYSRTDRESFEKPDQDPNNLGTIEVGYKKNIDMTNVLELRNHIEETYGIKILIPNYNTEQKILSSLQKTKEELDFFPYSFIRNIGLHTLEITSQIQGDRRGHINYPQMKIQYNPNYSHIKGGLVHELSHFFDYVDKKIDPATYGIDRPHNKDNVAWRKLTRINDSQYCGDQYRDCPLPNLDFAYDYGKASIDEDQATILEFLYSDYQYLMNKSNRREYNQVSSGILKAKIKVTKDFLEHLSSGQMDEYFWEEHRSKSSP